MKKEELILLNMVGVGKKALEKYSDSRVAQKLSEAVRGNDIDKELASAKKHGVQIITVFEDKYPNLLKKIHSPPIVLYVKGHLPKDSEYAVGIVGSRVASIYGCATAQKLAYQLASRGVVIVSGLARGIDSAAHKGALKAGGRTIAVLGNGLNTIYPPENKKLAGEIVENGGAVISEFPMAMEPLPRNFPIRNRIISGLSLGVIVVEAAKNSGALITADFALEQDREVFAVPGKIDSSVSHGTNELIKQGAKLVQSADDVIEELGLKLKEVRPDGRAAGALSPNLTKEEAVVYEYLSAEPVYLDQIVAATAFSVSKAADLLLRLRLKRLVRELPGKQFVKAD